VRVHHDRRHVDGAVGDPRREQLLLDRELQPGVDREAQVGARNAGLVDDRGLGNRPGIHVALREQDARRAGQKLLVLLLDAVLADALPVDEPDDVGGERRLRTAAGLRMGPDRLGLERHVGQVAGHHGRADPVGQERIDLAGDDDVRAPAAEPLVERHAGRRVEGEDPGQAGADLPSLVGRQLVGGDGNPVALDRRREHDQAASVIDRAAGARLLDPDRRLASRLGGEILALDDLPPGEAADDRGRGDDERRQQEQQAATRIRPTGHVRSID
jgi:hypothetical protein